MTQDGTFTGSVLIALDVKFLLNKGYGLADLCWLLRLPIGFYGDFRVVFASTTANYRVREQ
jgi:hypothetical protein